MGQIINRGKNKWLVRVPLGTKNGKRKYHNKTINGTKKDAEKYQTKVLRELDTNAFVQPAKETLADYLKNWMQITVKSRVRQRTFADYENLINRYIMPELGDNKLSQITPMMIQSFYNKMSEKGLTGRTVRYIHVVLRNAFERAVIWRILSHNPTQHADLPKHQKKVMIVLTPEEARRLLDCCVYSKWGILFEVLIVTGLRPGEAYGLRWTDIDFAAGRISIQRALTRINNQKTWLLEEPKTPGSKRSIPLPRTVLQGLKLHKKKQDAEKLKAKNYTDHGFVFATQNGEPLNESNVNYQYFKPLLRDAGLPSIRLYDLRHTCATLLLSAGENPKVVSERLGHASAALTLDVYSHVLPSMQEKATEKLEVMLFSANDSGTQSAHKTKK